MPTREDSARQDEPDPPCPSVLSDEELLERFALGHRDAFDELFRRYRQPAYGVAYHVLKNTDDALDAVQDGFARAFTHIQCFEGRAAVKTWLFEVVRNTALARIRARHPRRRAEQEYAVRRAAEDVRTPSDELAAKDRRQLVARILRKNTSPLMRLVYRLHVQEELTYADIAAIITRMTVNKVRYIMAKVIATLADRLAQFEESVF